MAELRLSFLIPLILLVVAALATVARAVDLETLSRTVEDDVYLLHGGPADRVYRSVFDVEFETGRRLSERFFGGDEGDEADDDPQPSFGRFNHIHAFNSFLLAVGLLTLALYEASLNGLLLALIVAVFWLNLPELEINEYDEMLREFDERSDLRSLSFHKFATVAAAAPPVVLSYVDVTAVAPHWKALAGVAYIVVGVFLIGDYFLRMLAREFETLHEKGDERRRLAALEASLRASGEGDPQATLAAYVGDAEDDDVALGMVKRHIEAAAAHDGDDPTADPDPALAALETYLEDAASDENALAKLRGYLRADG